MRFPCDISNGPFLVAVKFQHQEILGFNRLARILSPKIDPFVAFFFMLVKAYYTLTWLCSSNN
jgi:hypothetical protein